MKLFSWINYLAVKQKLLLLLVFILSAFVLMSAYTVATLNTQKQDDTIIDVASRQRLLSQKYNKEFFLALHQAKSTGEKLNYKQMNESQRLFEQSLTALTSGGSTYIDIGMTNKVTLPEENNSAILAQFSDVTYQWLQIQNAIKRINPQHYQLAQLANINTLSLKLLSSIERTVSMLDQRSNDRIEHMLNYQKVSWVIIILSSLLLIQLLSRNITQPLQEISATTQRFSNGNLKSYSNDNEHKHEDELGTVAFHADEMRFELNKMIHSIKQNSKQVFHSSEQIANISSEITAVNENQKDGSKTLINATNSLLEISASVNKQISETSTTTKETLVAATQCVNTLEKGLNGLNSTIDCAEATAMQINSVKTMTTQLHGIIKDLENIAAQANLLSINAVTEAARVGEQGRGFAIVAELTSQTVNSTSQLVTLINMLSNQIDNSIETISTMVERTNRFQENLLNCSTSFESIENKIIGNDKVSTEINQLTRQQNEYLPSLKTDLENLLNLINSNSNTADSPALVSNELHKVAKQLDTLLNRFKTDSVAARKRKGNEQRQYPRIKNQVKVILEQAGEMFEGITQDLSMAGLQIKCLKNLNFDIKNPINFHIYLPNQDKEELFVLPGNVIHANNLDEDFYYGVEFNSLNRKDKNSLQTIFNYFDKQSEFRSV